MYVQDKQSAIQMLDYSVTDYVWRVGRLKKQWTAQRLTKIRDERRPTAFEDSPWFSHWWVEFSDLRDFDWTQNVWWPDQLIFSSCGGATEDEEASLADREWQRFVVAKIRY
jgi:hypothetical protein